MTQFYADYIKNTTFDPDTNSVRSKLEEAATKDSKKNQHTSTPKMEVKPTEIPEGKMECPDCKGEGCEKCDDTGHISEKLHGDQHKLDHNKDMKITASDMKMVRKKGATTDHPAAEALDIDTKEGMSMTALKMRRASNPVKPVKTTNIVRSKTGAGTLSRNSVDAERKRNTMSEGMFRVNVEGLPTMHVSGSSASEIKIALRKMLKDPKAVSSIERITPSEKKSDLRAKMQEDQAAMDAYLKKGGKITKLPPARAQGSHGKADPGQGMTGMLDKGDTSAFKTRKKVKSMGEGDKKKPNNVNELSKQTMGSYVKKAVHNVDDRSYAQGTVDTTNKKYNGKNNMKIANRRAGINRAVNKMTSEDKMDEKFANAAQQAAAMASIKASGKYKKPKESVEEKDTHVTKDGRTVKKGLWYYMNKRKKAGTSRPASAGTVSPEAMKKSQK